MISSVVLLLLYPTLQLTFPSPYISPLFGPPGCIVLTPYITPLNPQGSPLNPWGDTSSNSYHLFAWVVLISAMLKLVFKSFKNFKYIYRSLVVGICCVYAYFFFKIFKWNSEDKCCILHTHRKSLLFTDKSVNYSVSY